MSLEQAVQDNTAAIRDLIHALSAYMSRPELPELIAPEIVKPVPEVSAHELVAHLANGTGKLAKGTLVITTAAELTGPVPETIVEITKEMVNAQLKAAVQAKGAPALRALFAEFGVSNFKDVTESQYAPMHAAATKLLEG